MSIRDQGNTLKVAAEEAQDAVAETATTAKSIAADVGDRAQQLAREAGRQATAAAETAYGAGGDVLSIVEDAARQNIWGALLIAGAVGYGLACLVKESR
jgi:hypothetical protein